MINETVKLKDLAEIEEIDLVKMIFSSGDYFPGFYRFTLGTQTIGEESLSLNTLVWLYFEQKLNNGSHSKEDWIDLQHEVHERDISSDQARNAGNWPSVRSLFTKKMLNWYVDAKGFDIIYLETIEKVDSFEENTSYYFMGAILHYREGCLCVGYDDLSKKSAFEIPVNLSELKDYLDEVFTQKDFNSLFLYASTVASLSFDKSDMGKLEMDEKLIDSYLLRNSETKVFASPIESRGLPMRYAKFIRLTNFRRGKDGQFEVWRTNQNW